MVRISFTGVTTDFSGVKQLGLVIYTPLGEWLGRIRILRNLKCLIYSKMRYRIPSKDWRGYHS